MDGYGVLYYEEEVIRPYQTLRAQYPHLNQPQYEGDFVHGMKREKASNTIQMDFYNMRVILFGIICKGLGSYITLRNHQQLRELARGVTNLHYEGHFFEDLKHGKGKVYSRDGILEAEGQFKEDMMTGQGNALLCQWASFLYW